jgi:hypothetical protein
MEPSVPDEAPELVRETLTSPGHPLDAGTRAVMEPRFGRDFSQVRVHNDQDAAESAQALNAKAFTAGPDLVFAAGRYSPGTPTGRNLIAHELAHVVQQASGPVAGTPIAGDMTVSHAGDRFELAANTIADGALPVTESKAPLHVPDSGGALALQRAGDPSEPANAPKGSAAPGGKQSIMEEPPRSSTPAPGTIPQGQASPNALTPSPLPYPTWEKIENRVSPELGINFLEIGRVATVDVKQQLYDVFSPYDTSIVDANQKFGSYLNIALSAAGNVPQDPGPSSPSTPSPTYSITGGLGGAIAQIGQVVVGNILDTGKVAVAKQRTALDVEALAGDILTTDGPIYDSFETSALSEVRGKAESDWKNEQETLPPELLTEPSATTYARYARREFGPHSSRVKSVITQFQAKLKPYLDKLKARLEILRKVAQRNRRKAALIGGAITGGIIGGALGVGLGASHGFLGGLAGGLGGAAIGAAFGTGAGAIGFEIFGKSDAPDEEPRSDDKRAEDRKNLQTIGADEKEDKKDAKDAEQEDKEDRRRK